MRHIPNVLKTLALSAVLLAGASSAALANGRSGIDLQPGLDCGIQVYLTNSSGVVMPKADSRLSGSYRFHLYQAIPTSDLDIRLDGRFSASANGRDTLLARNAFMLGYVVPNGRHGMPELRDAELGQDAMLRGSLQVYDMSGRLTCSTETVRIMPMALLTGVRVPPRQPARSSRYTQPEEARRAQERLAERQAQAGTRPDYVLTPAQCARLRAARPAQCRYDN